MPKKLTQTINDFDTGRLAYMVVYTSVSKTPVSIPVTVLNSRCVPYMGAKKEIWFIRVRLPWAEEVECDPNDLFEANP